MNLVRWFLEVANISIVLKLSFYEIKTASI